VAPVQPRWSRATVTLTGPDTERTVMSDASDDPVEDDPTDTPAGPDDPETDGTEDLEALRAEVEQKYDFENFGPQDMNEMTPEEWDVAFDPETWITGEQLFDRVEADLKTQVANRDVFARVERFDDLLIAYSDTGYAAVYPDGSVEGQGTVLRDVKPTVALCSMDSYEVPEMPEGDLLPEPKEVPESSDALGNTVMQVIAGVQVLAGLALLSAWVLYLTGVLSQPGTNTQGLNLVLLVVAGLGFLAIGIFLFVMVANARLSDKFRAEEFRNRLRAIGLEDGERPSFLDDLDGLEGELPAQLRREVTDTDDQSDSTEGRSGASDGEAGGESSSRRDGER